MAYNPYGAPAAQGPSPFAPPPPPGTPQPWEAGEVVGRAWEIVKVHWVPLVFAMMIGGVAASLPQQVSNVYRGVQHHGEFDFEDPVLIVLTAGGALVSWVLQAFFQAGFTKMFASAARGGTPEFAHLFAGGPRFFAMLGGMLLHGLLVILGFALLVVPGVILALGLMLYPYYIVDRGLGPVEALKASWDATMGHKGKLFVLGLYSFGIALVGFLACCVGSLPAMAIISVAQAVVYVRLTGTESVAGPPAGYGPPPSWGPPGGYGPPPGGYGPPPGGYGPPPGGYGPPPGGYGPPPGGYGPR